MLWTVQGREVPIGDFQSLQFDEVLGAYDGPRTFTLRDSFDELFLAHFCDEEHEIIRYVLVPFTHELLRRLKMGAIGVREALEQPRLWIVDSKGTWSLENVWRSNIAAVPPDTLPDRDVMLWPSLEPLLSLRTIGDAIGEGITPASVIADVVEGAKKAIRLLVEHVRALDTLTGRPSEARRRWYDLPAQRIQFASFEVAFRRPLEDSPTLIATGEIEERDQVYEKVGALLQKGLEWLLETWPNEPKWESDEERKAVLEAIESLIPSTVGPVQTLQLRGQLVSRIEDRIGRTIQLNKESKQAVRSALTQRLTRTEEIKSEIGFIRELDKDRYTFELRSRTDDTQLGTKFSFDEDLADDVNAATYLDQLVQVVGVQESRRRVIRAKIIHFVYDQTEDHNTIEA